MSKKRYKLFRLEVSVFRSLFINLHFQTVTGYSTADAVMRNSLSKNTVDDKPPELTCCLQRWKRRGWTSIILNIITRLTVPAGD